MKANILTDRLPDTVIINGAEHRINSDFRVSIRFDIMIRDKSIPDAAKMIEMLKLYYNEIPEDVNEAVSAILLFYNCGEDKSAVDTEENEKKHTAKKKKNIIQYSFSQDAPYIYAAFQEQYGINLQQIQTGGLHWWEFIAMFRSLHEDTKMGQIMYYRTVSTSGMPNAKRKAINELKKLYAINDDTDVDSKVSLTKRNSEMMDYVRRRVEDARKE